VLYPAELKSAYFLMISAYVPRPIALVSSISADGVGNVAPYSYSGCIAHDPPTLVVSCCRRPDGRSILCPAGSRAIGLPLRNGFRFSR
jgi:flavin reductase (DIM6/NTAB) family NADH-FMN oxidoreductase RutF